VYDDIMRTRGVDWVNNFGRRWRTTRRSSGDLGQRQEVMAPERSTRW